MTSKRTLRRRNRHLRETIRLLEQSLQTLVGSNRRLIEAQERAQEAARTPATPVDALHSHPAESDPAATAYRQDET